MLPLSLSLSLLLVAQRPFATVCLPNDLLPLYAPRMLTRALHYIYIYIYLYVFIITPLPLSSSALALHHCFSVYHCIIIRHVWSFKQRQGLCAGTEGTRRPAAERSCGKETAVETRTRSIKIVVAAVIKHFASCRGCAETAGTRCNQTVCCSQESASSCIGITPCLGGLC